MQTRVEKMVCADRAIAELDEYLGRYYAASRAEIPGAGACLQSDQAQWLKSTRDACVDGACLKSAYLNRLAELDPLQPGATALKNVTLPPFPALVWVVPPAADKVAAPPNPKAKPYEAIGTLVDDHLSQRRDHSAPIWTLFMFDAFLRNVAGGAADTHPVGKAA